MTSVFRLKAARPHFAAVDEASHPNIIMRRSSTSERTVTPASGQRRTKPVEHLKILTEGRRTNKSVPEPASAALRNPDHLRAALATDRISTSMLKEPIATGPKNGLRN